MKRSKRTRHETRYPAVDGLLDRRAVLTALGGLVGGATLSGCLPGPVLLNGIEEPEGIVTYDVTMPVSPGSWTVWFHDGVIDYHVELKVTDPDLADELREDVEGPRARMNEVLANYDIHTFAPGEDFAAIEELLEDAIAEASGGDLSDFRSCRLVVDYWDDEPQIDGDIG
jgi:hypothetical protein